MNALSKIVTLSIFAAGAAVIASAAPSPAQIARPAVVYPGGGIVTPAPVCCQLTTKPIDTGSAGWTVKLPSGPVITPVPVVPKHPAWAAPLPGSQWIANVANAGQAGQPGGTYIYTYHFCLCQLPGGIKTVPASLTLHIYADDDFVAKLNGVQIAQKTGGYGFNMPPGGTPVSIASTNFTQCDNVLTFEVHNMLNALSPTGLDVAGSVSGYFQDVAPGKPCPCGRPIN